MSAIADDCTTNIMTYSKIDKKKAENFDFSAFDAFGITPQSTTYFNLIIA